MENPTLNGNSSATKPSEEYTVEQLLTLILRRVNAQDAVMRNVQTTVERLETTVDAVHEMQIVQASRAQCDSTPDNSDSTPNAQVQKKQRLRKRVKGNLVLDSELSELQVWLDIYMVPNLTTIAPGISHKEQLYRALERGLSFRDATAYYVSLPSFLRWLRVQKPFLRMTRPRLCELLHAASWRVSIVRGTHVDPSGGTHTLQKRYWRKAL